MARPIQSEETRDSAPLIPASASSERPARKAPTSGSEDRVQLRVVSPDGIRLILIDENGQFDTSESWIVPATINLAAGRKYRFKLDQMPGREAISLFPSVKIPQKTPATARFLENNAIIVQFTDEEFDRILSGEALTKAIYNPGPESAEEDRLRKRLEGGTTAWTSNFMLEGVLDPIEEADREGDILAIIEIGTINLQSR